MVCISSLKPNDQDKQFLRWTMKSVSRAAQVSNGRLSRQIILVYEEKKQVIPTYYFAFSAVNKSAQIVLCQQILIRNDATYDCVVLD